MADLFQYELSDRYVLTVFVEQKRFLDGIYQLPPFNKTGIVFLRLFVAHLSSMIIRIDDLLIFVRLYNSHAESLMYVGHFLFSEQQSLRKTILFLDSSRRITSRF